MKKWHRFVDLEEDTPKDEIQYRAYALVFKLLSLHTLLRTKTAGRRLDEIRRKFYDHLNMVVELVAEAIRRKGGCSETDSGGCRENGAAAGSGSGDSSGTQCGSK